MKINHKNINKAFDAKRKKVDKQKTKEEWNCDRGGLQFTVSAT